VEVFEHRWSAEADGGVQSVGVAPVDPGGGLPFDGGAAGPGRLSVDELGAGARSSCTASRDRGRCEIRHGDPSGQASFTARSSRGGTTVSAADRVCRTVREDTVTNTNARRDDELRQLESARRDLVQEFQDRLSVDQVSSRFDAIVAEFDDAPVRTFVPVLARRRAHRELSTSA
jgi:hypothetical protein